MPTRNQPKITPEVLREQKQAESHAMEVRIKALRSKIDTYNKQDESTFTLETAVNMIKSRQLLELQLEQLEGKKKELDKEIGMLDVEADAHSWRYIAIPQIYEEIVDKENELSKIPQGKDPGHDKMRGAVLEELEMMIANVAVLTRDIKKIAGLTKLKQWGQELTEGLDKYEKTIGKISKMHNIKTSVE